MYLYAGREIMHCKYVFLPQEPFTENDYSVRKRKNWTQCIYRQIQEISSMPCLLKFSLCSTQKKNWKTLLWTEDIGSAEFNRSAPTGSRNASCKYQDDCIFTRPPSPVTTNHPSVPLAWHWNAQLGMYSKSYCLSLTWVTFWAIL